MFLNVKSGLCSLFMLTPLFGFCQEAEASPWLKGSLKPGMEILFFDQAAEKDARGALSLGLSHPLSEAWSLELTGLVVPYDYGHTDTGCGLGVSLDGLYHLTRFDRLDPYFALGAGYYHGESSLAGPRAGLGLQYHLTEQLALSVDGRAMLSVDGCDMLYSAGVGLSYRFGAPAGLDAKHQILPDGRLDSDGDGLADDDESTKGTDPFNKDSDRDGLSDFEEVVTTLTDPLNPDTDFDTLTDGEEVKKYKTNPLKRDSDGGGVDDWHERFIDKTDPLNPRDDLFLIVIPASFAYTLQPFNPTDLEALDLVVARLLRFPETTVRIEVHSDRKVRADQKAAFALTEQVALQIATYFKQKGVAPKRLNVKGFGFDRPRVQPNLVRGNPENQRFEFYIR
jgi:OmpA family/Bacterial TSP3 repeat